MGTGEAAVGVGVVMRRNTYAHLLTKAILLEASAKVVYFSPKELALQALFDTTFVFDKDRYDPKYDWLERYGIGVVQAAVARLVRDRHFVWVFRGCYTRREDLA